MEKRDYSEFKNIDIFDTGLVEDNAITRRHLEKNGIRNLADLFEKDDNKEIIYPNAVKARSLRSLVPVARYKYLGEDIYLGLEKDLKQKHKKEDWLNITTRNDKYFKMNLVSSPVTNGWSSIVLGELAYKQYDNDFSLFDILTNEEIRDNLRSGTPTVEKNKLLLIGDCILEKEKKNVMIETTDDMVVLLEEEKKLLNELAKLNEQSEILAKRINEIQQQKSAMMSGRSV